MSSPSTPIPTIIFQTPSERAASRLCSLEILVAGLHGRVREHAICHDQRLIHAEFALKDEIYNRINLLGGMAGEW
jgi:hypothetical protein